MTTTQTETTNIIGNAVEPRRAEAIGYALERASDFVAAIRAQLEKAGWDLEVAAPYPHFTAGKKEYAVAKARRVTFNRLVTSVSERCRMRNDPDFVRMDDAKVSAFMTAVATEASAQFDAYIAKLSAKVGPVTSASLDAGHLWVFSHLTVTPVGGAPEVWRTQMIINVSSLGKLFNQWPTRKVKVKASK
jgi:hypothetical protein